MLGKKNLGEIWGKKESSEHVKSDSFIKSILFIFFSVIQKLKSKREKQNKGKNLPVLGGKKMLQREIHNSFIFSSQVQSVFQLNMR